MKETPFGEWVSPITPEVIAKGSSRLGPPRLVDGSICWTEPVTDEDGRVTLMSSASGSILDTEYNIGTAVHEYGGGDWWFAGESVYFSNKEDSQLYKMTGSKVAQVTESDRTTRYADGDAIRNGTTICIRETHSDTGVANELVSISADKEVKVLVSGPDFVSNPRISPDGTKLCWIEWNHPNMPWDAVSLKVADITEQGLENIVEIAGGDSAPQCPGWLADGNLVFADDKSGFWNLYAVSLSSNRTRALTSFDGVETGRAHWSLGDQTWVELDDNSIVFVVTADAIDSLARISPNGQMSLFETGLVSISSVSKGVGPLSVVVLASDQSSSAQIVSFNLDQQSAEVIRPSGLDMSDQPGLSKGVREVFESDGVKVHGFFYPPASAEFSGPVSELPPLIVMGHGGPTGHNSNGLSLKVQFWTSRGFAVADVNYRGSTGFGREYRHMINGEWGVVDVNDQIAMAEHLVKENLVNPNAVAIRGASSGGLTVMSALAKSEVFKCGVSIFGVGDLVSLATDTHKFESRYLDNLVGPYPNAKEVYEARSPLSNIDKLTKPMLFLHGSDDFVVPPSQSEIIFRGLRDRGILSAMETFAGEGHGFRKPENITRSLELELWFYGQIFGFEPRLNIDISGAKLHD